LWRDSIADLKLDVATTTSELEVVWESMEALKLRHAEPAILPMERSNVRARLTLERRRWALRIELQKEGPVPRSPLEQRMWVTFMLRVVQIVSTRRDLGEQVPILAIHRLLRLRRCSETLECLPGCHMRQQRTDIAWWLAPFMLAPMSW